MTAYAAYARSEFPVCRHCGLPTVPAPDGAFDDERQQVVIDGEHLRLGTEPWTLLVLLRRRPGKVFSYEAILAHLYGHKYAGGDRRDLRAIVYRLRNRLRGSEWHIRTVTDVGYALVKREGQ